MTDKDRRESERLAFEWAGHDFDQWTSVQTHFIAGYKAACEAKKAEHAKLLDQLEAAYSASRALVEDVEGLEIDLGVERARAAKFAGYLKSLALLQTPQATATEFWVEVSNELEASRD